jgi:ubiquinone biosynthesis protein
VPSNSAAPLEELGPTFIKLGQLLSSRPDLLPDVYIHELSKLVDTVPPVPFEAIRTVIDEEIGLDKLASIDPEPLATASVAQMPRAPLGSWRGSSSAYVHQVTVEAVYHDDPIAATCC